MSSKLTVPQILAALESQIALHREREAFHARQEAMHREERARHAAELERVTKNYETLQASTADFAALPRATSPKGSGDIVPGERPKLTRLVSLAVADLEPDRPFAASELAAEIDHRFGEHLKKPVNPRHVAIALRRMLDRGHLRIVRKGRPHTETLYARQA